MLELVNLHSMGFLGIWKLGQPTSSSENLNIMGFVVFLNIIVFPSKDETTETIVQNLYRLFSYLLNSLQL